MTLLGACSAHQGGPSPSMSGSGDSSDEKQSEQSAESDSAWLRAAMLPVDRLTSSFQWRQRVTARFGDQQRSFEAVLSKQPGELQLLGLGPMGTVGFVLRLSQSEADSEPLVEFINRSPMSFPFDARYILLDVQRVFYPWFSAPSAANGSRSSEVVGGTVTESWLNHQLVERRFLLQPGERGAGRSSSGDEIAITFHQWQAGRAAPLRVELVNALRGYELSIETLEQETLAP